MDDDQTPAESEVDDRPLTLGEALGSVFSAAIGIQSNRNRERDFRRGSARQYIVLGIVVTLGFVGAVYALVRLVLATALP